MLIVDPPLEWANASPSSRVVSNALVGLRSLGQVSAEAQNAALYFPRVVEASPNEKGRFHTVAPSGAVAGVIARTDDHRGVWNAPAGKDASLIGIQGLELDLTDDETGRLNKHGINCLRTFPMVGPVVWGARILCGADQFADEYQYVPIRRLALYIEESLYRGTQWAVFEPNGEQLWTQIRLAVGAFMHDLFRQGAFQGESPSEAYLVKCDAETTMQEDLSRGIVNIIVGFAPLKPAEFIFINIQHEAGQVDT
jgi:phage tail sheath protein FI